MRSCRLAVTLAALLVVVASVPCPMGRAADGTVPAAATVKTTRNPQDGAEMVYVPAGEFKMGDDAQAIYEDLLSFKKKYHLDDARGCPQDS